MSQFPMTFAQAEQFQVACAQERHLPLILTLPVNRRVQMELVLIPPGEFVMGSPEDAPVHPVQFSAPFYLGRYAVTQAQWLAVMDSNPAHFNHDEALPIETVTWEACVDFCQKLSKLAGYPTRLPSEAEWEYACRAGSQSAYSFGEAEAELDQYGWYRDNANGLSHPVGRKKRNAWGLYDMHGGIDEYCQDVWHPSYEAAPADGSAWIEHGEQAWRVLRGGSWYDVAEHCGSGHRNYYAATEPSEDHGCRIVFTTTG
jgi:formylglycine-generating enzyme required for sulfatase activity